MIFGGVGQGQQVKALQQGVDILIATPGRLLDLYAQRHVSFDQVSILVLDEADRMLDMGFIRDVRKIVAACRKERQTLLFSATMPPDIAKLAAEILRNPARIDVSPATVTVDRIDQRVYFVPAQAKRDLLVELLADPAMDRVLVFTRTKHGADKVCKFLRQAGLAVDAIHGNKAQNARVRALEAFRSGQARVLVATDIAARGIDVVGNFACHQLRAAERAGELRASHRPHGEGRRRRNGTRLLRFERAGLSQGHRETDARSRSPWWSIVTPGPKGSKPPRIKPPRRRPPPTGGGLSVRLPRRRPSNRGDRMGGAGTRCLPREARWPVRESPVFL